MSVLSSLRKQAVSCVCRPFLKIYIIGRSLWAKEKGGKVSAGQTYTIKYKNTQYSNKHICKTITRMKIDQFRVVAHFKFAATFIIYFPRIKKHIKAYLKFPFDTSQHISKMAHSRHVCIIYTVMYECTSLFKTVKLLFLSLTGCKYFMGSPWGLLHDCTIGANEAGPVNYPEGHICSIACSSHLFIFLYQKH